MIQFFLVGSNSVVGRLEGRANTRKTLLESCWGCWHTINEIYETFCSLPNIQRDELLLSQTELVQDLEWSIDSHLFYEWINISKQKVHLETLNYKRHFKISWLQIFFLNKFFYVYSSDSSSFLSRAVHSGRMTIGGELIWIYSPINETLI